MMTELITIQDKLKAPKKQFNQFGRYTYRNCEDILEAVKPLLHETKCYLSINDDIVLIGDRFYVKSTATITNSKGERESACGFAREPLERKGMDASQVTGSSSSYARKYALNGLFCIDDSKDMDTLNTEPSADANALLTQGLAELDKCSSREEVVAVFNKYPSLQPLPEFINKCKDKSASK